MLGRMQDWPLLMHKVIDFAATQFPDREVASRLVEGPMHRTNYREIRQRALKVAKRLEKDGDPARRPRRDARLEQLPPSRGLVRHRGARRDLPYDQSAPVSRADRLDRQSRRGPDRDDGPDLRAAARKRSPTICRRSSASWCMTDAAHMPATEAEERHRLTRSGSARSTTISPGRSSTSGPPAASATRRAPPAIRRACSTRIGRTSCIP